MKLSHLNKKYKIHKLPKRTDNTIGGREGRDVIKGEIGIEIEKIDQSHDSLQADIFNKLKVRKDHVPVRPLTEGKLE